jgi:hypothetical protein
MEEPPSRMKVSATRAPTDRSESRYSGHHLQNEAVFLSPISSLEQR